MKFVDPALLSEDWPLPLVADLSLSMFKLVGRDVGSLNKRSDSDLGEKIESIRDFRDNVLGYMYKSSDLGGRRDDSLT